MNILITNSALKYGSGTETFVRDFAVKLRALGYSPAVYCTRVGPIAEETVKAGVPVVTDLRQVPFRPDIIHGHHHIQTIDALVHFPGAPGIFVCHDRMAKHDVPPPHGRICFYVAVDHNCQERFIYAGIPEEKVRVIYNSVDTDRFLPRAALPARPRRALAFSYASTSKRYLGAIADACRESDIEFDIACTESGTGTQRPQDVLGQYDLVFAKARCAMEAMAVGAAVILAHKIGFGPMVTMAQMQKLRPLNFGMRCLNLPLEKKVVIEQIRRFDAQDAAAVSRYMREHAGLTRMAEEYADLYREALSKTSGREAPVSDEVDRYAQALVRQAGKSRGVLSSHRSVQARLMGRCALQYLMKTGRKIRKGIRKIAGEGGPARPKAPAGIPLPSPDLTCHAEFKDRLKSVDELLTKIALAEKILLEIVMRKERRAR